MRKCTLNLCLFALFSLCHSESEAGTETVVDPNCGWIQLELQQPFVPHGGSLNIPINYSSQKAGRLQDLNLSLSYDSKLFTYYSHSTGGTLTEGWPIHSTVTDSTVSLRGASGVSLTGSGTLVVLHFRVNDAATEGSCGVISLDNGQFNQGDYCVAPIRETYCGSLKGDASEDGLITTGDATQLLRHVTRATTEPPHLDITQADTTCDGTLSTLDAAYILERLAGQTTSFCEPRPGSNDDVTVNLPDLTLASSEPLILPLVLSDTTGMDIKGVAFTLNYPADYLRITELDSTGTLLAGLDWLIEINTSVPGQTTVALAGFTPLTGSGTLLNLVGTAQAWGQMTLEITALVFNEGQPNAELPDAPTNYTILGFGIDPPSVALGLQIPQLEVRGLCCGEMELEWRDPVLDLVLPGNPLILNPPPLQSKVYEARITNPITLQTVVKMAHVLVPVEPFPLDYNGDGFNSLEDLNMLLPDWGQPLAIDPNGDGTVDIRDFLYINVQDELNE